MSILSHLTPARFSRLAGNAAAPINLVPEARSKERLAKIQEWLKQENLDGALFVNSRNIFWLTGFKTVGADPEEVFLVVTQNRVSMFTSPFYEEKAKRFAPHIPLTVPGDEKEPLRNFISSELREAKTLAVEGRDMSAYRASWLKAALPGLQLKFMHIVENLRMQKSPEEIQAMRQAIEITRKGIEAVARQARPGVSERDLVKVYRRTLLDEGAEEAFNTIIAAGPHGAEPHFDEPSDKPLKEGDLIVMDVGARVNGVNSDITRMIVVGKPSEFAKKILAMVQVAQGAGVMAAYPGQAAYKVDEAARGHIKRQGYNFMHGTGHGLGLDVHEAPRAAPKRDVEDVLEPPEEMKEFPSFLHILQPGDVITVEPGNYFPGKLGVRIEDDVLITKEGHDDLSDHIPQIFHARGESFLQKMRNAWEKATKRFRVNGETGSTEY